MSKEDLSDNFKYPAYSAESTNNGIVGYAEKPDFIVDENHSVYICFGDHTRTFNIAKKSFSVLDNVKVLHPCTDNIYALLFMISIWHKKIPNLGYSRHWKIAKDCIITLPITSSGEIDFDFMESFIRELEEERIRELAAYLKVSGFDNYELSKSESEALAHFKELKWKEFKVGELFEILSYKKRFDANKVRLSQTGHPYIGRTALNNGMKGYLNEDEKYLNDGNTISFGQDTATMFYQEKPYFTGDKIKILKPKNKRFNKLNSMFFITEMTKAFSNFSWGSSSFSIDVISGQIISLPVTDAGEIDFDFMETFVSAVQKLVIKDVVLYADQKIAATKEAVKK